jgi:hypothetical protein
MNNGFLCASAPLRETSPAFIQSAEIYMSKMTVNNPNILVVARTKETPEQQAPLESQLRRNRKLAIIRRIKRARERLEEIACSSTWAEDCLFRGADYVPDFQCKCPLCTAIFRQRLYPRSVRESDYALDCQVECDEDPELAEDLARLRNERLRLGSVFVGRMRKV